MMKEKSEFVIMAEIIDKLKDKYYEKLEKKGYDGAYFPIRITIWETDMEFKPLRKLIEIDEREINQTEVE